MGEANFIKPWTHGLNRLLTFCATLTERVICHIGAYAQRIDLSNRKSPSELEHLRSANFNIQRGGRQSARDCIQHFSWAVCSILCTRSGTIAVYSEELVHCALPNWYFFFQSRKRFYRRHDAAVESWSVLLLLLVHNLEAGQNRRRHVGGSWTGKGLHLSLMSVLFSTNMRIFTRYWTWHLWPTLTCIWSWAQTVLIGICCSDCFQTGLGPLYYSMSWELTCTQVLTAHCVYMP